MINDDEYFDDEEISEDMIIEENEEEILDEIDIYENLMLKIIDVNSSVNAQSDMLMALMKFLKVPTPKGIKTHLEWFNGLKQSYYAMEAVAFLDINEDEIKGEESDG